MVELKPGGTTTSAIKVDVDIDAKIEGHSTYHLSDGDTDGPSRQEFVRIEHGRLAAGDWLLNPNTKETHKVLSSDDDDVEIETLAGPVKISWSDAESALLLVLNV